MAFEGFWDLSSFHFETRDGSPIGLFVCGLGAQVSWILDTTAPVRAPYSSREVPIFFNRYCAERYWNAFGVSEWQMFHDSIPQSSNNDRCATMHGGNGLDQIWVVVQYCRTSLVYVSWIQHCVQSRKARAKSKSLRHFRAKSNPLNTYQSPFKKPSKHYSCDEACLAMQCMLADCATRYASINLSQGTVLTDWEKYIAGTSCTISASQHMQLQAKSQSLAFQYIAAAMLVSSALVVVWTTSELNLQHYSNTCAVQGGRLTIFEIRSESSSTNQTDFPDNHNPYSNVAFMCGISYRIDQVH